MLLTIGALVLVLGPLIFVHELGHFFVAKVVGVQVLRFSIGFGRPILKARWGETEYCLSILPLGGYVKMAGMEEQEGVAGDLEGGRPSEIVDPARAFDRKSIPARLAVLVAGVSMNLAFAWLIYTTISATVGSRELGTTQVDFVNAAQLPQGARALAELRFGDRILRVNGDTLRSWDGFVERVVVAPGDLRIDVAGRPAPLVIHFGGTGLREREALIGAVVPLEPPRIGLVDPGLPAGRAGLRPGDLILRANGDTIVSWNALLRVVWHSPDRQISLDALRGDSVVHLTLTPKRLVETDSTSPRPKVYGQIGAGVDQPIVHVPQTVPRAALLGVRETLAAAAQVVGTLKGLLLGQLSVREVGGPILIAQISGQVARLGFEQLLRFMAFFSVNLALLNLLPVPLLDGGQIVFVLAEAVRRKPLSLNTRLRLQQVGFVLLLCLMALAIGNDVVRSFFH